MCIRDSATGTAAAPFLRGLVQRAQADYPGLRGQVIAVENDFFGDTIDVDVYKRQA